MRPARPRTTIVHVARRAKVALSTVSRVLNGGYASSEVRARVERVARELGYTPSLTARNLKMGRQGSIGVVGETSQGAWFTQILGGIEETLEPQSLSVLLGSLALRGHYDSTTVMRWVRERRVDGIIFVRCTAREKNLIDAARRARLPVVFVSPDEHFEAGPVFGARNRDAAFELTQHLLSLGHTRFQFVGGLRDSTDTQERLRGVRDALAAHDLALAAAHVGFAGSYRGEDSIPFAERWLQGSRAQAPTAVILANDALAANFMRVLLQRGVSVPREVSIAGFDGAPESAVCWPGLTTAAQPTREMGSAACRTLLKIVDEVEPTSTARLDLPMTLVLRESTGAAPGRRQRRQGQGQGQGRDNDDSAGRA